ncbi:MAG: HAMP domain-containing sensor histidine kinase [Myxococcota bacterium]
MADSGAPVLDPSSKASRTDLAFGVVRPLFVASTLEELGRAGLQAVRSVAPRATATFGWRFADWTGPPAWRWSPRDAEPRAVHTWAPVLSGHGGSVLWQTGETASAGHRLWLAVGESSRLGGFELVQSDGFPSGAVGRLGAVREAMLWSAQRLRDRRRFEEEYRQIRATVDARTTFYAQMSHELRTPLNAILGYVELLREEHASMSTDEVLSDLSRVHTSATHVLSIVNDVLDLAKAERGHSEVGQQPVNLPPLIHEIDDLARPLMAEHGNRWVVHCPDEIWVYADGRRLRQVLTNLIGNAAKFTERGEVRLEVGRIGRDIAIAVADSGIGMSKETLARVFEPFEQVHGDADRYGGTGLGLAIAAQYVHQMGGAIDVQSELGVGTRFVVTLPASSPG